MGVMPKKKHHIRLSAEERVQLETIVRKGKANAHRQRHARIRPPHSPTPVPVLTVSGAAGAKAIS